VTVARLAARKRLFGDAGLAPAEAAWAVVCDELRIEV